MIDPFSFTLTYYISDWYEHLCNSKAEYFFSFSFFWPGLTDWPLLCFFLFLYYSSPGVLLKGRYCVFISVSSVIVQCLAMAWRKEGKEGGEKGRRKGRKGEKEGAGGREEGRREEEREGKSNFFLFFFPILLIYNWDITLYITWNSYTT